MGNKGKKRANYPNKMGRKKRTFTDEEYNQIEQYAGSGLSMVQIAHILEPPISEATIQRRMNDDARFERAIKKGRSKAIHQVANKVFENAMSGKETSAFFFLKTRDPENWNDRQVVEHNINLGEVLAQAQKRVIDLSPERAPELEQAQKRLSTRASVQAWEGSATGEESLTEQIGPASSERAGADNNKQDNQSD